MRHRCLVLIYNALDGRQLSHLQLSVYDLSAGCPEELPYTKEHEMSLVGNVEILSRRVVHVPELSRTPTSSARPSDG